MKIKNHCAIWPLLFVTQITVMIAAVESRTQSGGLALELSVNNTSPQGLEISCRLTNQSSSDVPYSIVSDAQGFSVELRDGAGTPVPLQPGAKGLFVNFDFAEIWMHQRGLLKVNESIVFTRKLVELFQVDNPAGYTLKVRWDPGIDPHGNRRPVDPKLVAEIKIPKLVDIKNAPQTKLENLTPTKTSPEAGSFDPKKIESESATHDWLKTGIIIFAAVLILLLIRKFTKKRSA